MVRKAGEPLDIGREIHELKKRLAVIEKTLVSHDAALRDVIQKIRPLLLPPPDPPRKRIGFHSDP